MNISFEKVEDYFLSSASVDYVALHEICSETMKQWRLSPRPEEFQLALEFITYLYKKYSNYLVCLKGPDMKPINKNPEELVKWLQEEYDKGRYKLNIDYGVWFTLDTTVIPKKYLPPYPAK